LASPETAEFESKLPLPIVNRSLLAIDSGVSAGAVPLPPAVPPEVPAVPAVPANPPPATQAASAGAGLDEFWYATVRQLMEAEAITALVRELALQSQLVACDSAEWLLRVERESLNQPAARERLQNALQAAGHPVRLAVQAGAITDSPARRNAQAAAEKQHAAEAVIHNDPFVQAMVRDFGARIVPGSIKPL
jgi:DNA polymerase-3 subunit gamma/tau